MSIQIEGRETCLICDSNGVLLYTDMYDRLYDVTGSWNFYICRECQIIWLNPRPMKEDIEKLYKNYHTHGAINKTNKTGIKEEIKKKILNDKFGYQVPYSLPIWFGGLLTRITLIQDMVGAQIMMLDNKRKGRLLDVGAGNGIFMQQIRDLGWDVIGVEQDQIAATLAEEEFGLKVLSGSFDDLLLETESFDVITMDHVIEHLPDPIKSLRKAYHLLKPGGFIALMTPNLESYGHVKFKGTWLHLDPPRHFYLFSRNSLIKLVNDAGFSIVNTRTVSSSAWWVWIASHIIRRSGKIQDGRLKSEDLNRISKIKGIVFEVIEEMFRLIPNPIYENPGEEIYIMAKKISGF